ncbi:MAG: metallophosphatase [Flavobacteriales bacterium]|nr:Trifunctional nucleotide phosphoesterase protein YfkN [Flavobacteriales bacterium]MBX2959117.1 metallophosphatase [Flavobacteriales bacterium]
MAEFVLNNRRKFIKQSLLASGGLLALNALPFSSFALADKKHTKITILHTNDVHSHIEPFPKNDPKHANLGGAARRAAIINDIRNREKNVLLLDAGDIFQGTPYFNKYLGELDFKLMSLMQYDAATIGNHDFDNGIDGLKNVLPHASFPFINSNYDFSNTILYNNVLKHKIFIKENIKIGVFGLGVELEGLVNKSHYKETIYQNPIEIAQQTASYLKNEEQCDLVICLSHLGYSYKNNKVSDLVLAEQTNNIDLIIGGHTHTFLEKPTEVKNLSQKKVLVNQVGWAGINLGRIDFYVTTKKSASYYQSSVQAVY